MKEKHIDGPERISTNRGEDHGSSTILAGRFDDLFSEKTFRKRCGRARVSADPVREAAGRVSGAIKSAMDGEKADVVPMERGR